MATTYGYVIFKFQVFPGQKRTPIDLQDADGLHYLDVLLEGLKELRDRGTLPENPNADPEGDTDEDDDEDATPPKTTRLTRVETVHEQGWTISFKARYGRVGSHDLAMAEGVPDISLADKAPSRPHRGLFLIPPSGETGLVAIEVIGKSQPLPLVVRWLKQVSPVPWRIKTAKSSDEAAFLQALQATQNMVVELEKLQPGEDNTLGGQRMKVHAPVVTTSRRQQVTDTILGWIGRRDHNASNPSNRLLLDAGAEARGLATIAEPELRDVSFDDAKVVIEDNDGVKRVFQPELKFSLFTYYLGESRPTDDVFYPRVRDSMRRQFESTEIEMPPDWHSTRD